MANSTQGRQVGGGMTTPSPTHFPAHRRRWFEAADLRHATFGPPVGQGDTVRTLCGRSAVAVAVTPGRYAAQCPDCDRQWRIAEGVPTAMDQVSRNQENGAQPWRTHPQAGPGTVGRWTRRR